MERGNIIIDGNGYKLQGPGQKLGPDGYASVGVGLLANNITVKNMKIMEFYAGIVILESSFHTITENNINNCWTSILIDRSSNSTVSRNNFIGCGLEVYRTDSCVIVENNVNGKPLIYLEGVSDYVLGGEAGQIILSNCDNIVVKNFNISNTNIGVQLDGTNNSWLLNNELTKNGIGMMIGFSSNNIIYGNNIKANNDCVVWILNSFNNSFYRNNIRNNLGGINLGSVDIMGGIVLDKGLNNTIFHNNFINNTEHVHVRESLYVYIRKEPEPPDSNSWDNGYPSGGNYWSDCNGTDLFSGPYQNETGSDGIGDIPHVINEYNQDNYPLMAPIRIFDAGTWDGRTYFVDVISKSTISDFYFNPHEGPFLRFNVSGGNGTIGFCRVTIPKDLLWVEDGWKVLVGNEPVEYTTIQSENYTYIHFSYNHSTKTVQIIGTSVIPEFPSYLPLIFLISTLIATIPAKRHRIKKSSH